MLIRTESKSYFIALGSNLGSKVRNLSAAITAIDEQVGIVTARSEFYQSPALVHPDNSERNPPDYLNAVISIRSRLSPQKVLASLLKIEAAVGRNRLLELEPWSSRIIDLDLIAAGEDILEEPNLIVPHPRMHQRRFVLEPLAEIAPDWVHPILKRSVRDLLSSLSEDAC